jgi:DNA helicase-2/ATP-dependent DNA helicase PcrA
LFVDEAQDTFREVVAALNGLCDTKGLPLVGYFGDPMQQIFEDRAGDFTGPADSASITKKENYRCSPEVITLLNAFRTDVQQVPAGENANVQGSVRVTLVAAETPAGPRNKYTDEQIDRACMRFDEAIASWGWDDHHNVKRLFLVRRMIARRLGFPELHELFTGTYASTKAQEEYEEGSHFLLKPFVDFLCPLMTAEKFGDARSAFAMLRTNSPAFDPRGVNARKTLQVMSESARVLTQELAAMWGKSTIRQILGYCEATDLCTIAPRLREHLDRDPRDEEYDADAHVSEKGDWLADTFMDMPTTETEAFAAFVSENTPYSTQHGVKGEEYEDVLVVFDDTEAAWHQYSFGKTLTPGTHGQPTEGQQVRSRKLAYVCFSRAEKNLRILLFTPDPVAAKQELVSVGLFEESQVTIAG